MIGAGWGPALPMEGSLPPDLQGTLFRVGPAGVPAGRGGLGDGGLAVAVAVGWRWPER